MSEVRFGAVAQDYARHRAGFPESFFDRLAARGAGLPGQRVVDLGTGTGTLALGLARRGCRVTGVDTSAELLEQARLLGGRAALQATWVEARAEETGLPSASADLVTAGQCWHWFDRPRAAREAARLLAPDGRLVIAHFDWLPLPETVVEATEALILEHNPHWTLAGGTGRYPQWQPDVAAAGFHPVEQFWYDVTVAYSHEDWRGRIRASAGVGASLAPESVRAFDARLARLLAERFPREPLDVPHRVFALIAPAPKAA